jgi:hypothetical protein
MIKFSKSLEQVAASDVQNQTQSHDSQVINEFTGYILSHEGKATDLENVYDPARGPDAITNQNVYDKVVQYNEAVRTRHGADYDSSTEPLDTDVLMRTGGGKQHGKYFIAHSVIDRPPFPPFVRFVVRAAVPVPPLTSPYNLGGQAPHR